MHAMAPDDLHKEFMTRFNAGDVEGLMALYEREAVLVPQPGTTSVGYAANRQALQQFLALKGRMEIKTLECIRSGPLALLRGEWHLTGTGPDGNPVSMSGRNVEVARQQGGGNWQFVIDHPFGGG